MAPDDRRKLGPFGTDGRVDPESLVPDDEERAAGPEGPSVDILLRALSVVPFLLVAAVGLLGAVSWVLIIVLGAGSAEPVWRSVRGLSGAELVWQLLLAVLVGILPIAVTVAASWAAAHGFRESSGRPFWILVEGTWGLVAVGLVYVDRTRHDWLDGIGLSGLDWWFGFGVVAFAMVLAGIRLRRAPHPEETEDP